MTPRHQNTPFVRLNITLWLAAVAILSAGCSSDGTSENGAASADASTADIGVADPLTSDASTGSDASEGPNADVTGSADVDVATALRCDYTNAFSQGPECKNYLGASWTEQSASADCAAADGTMASDGPCDYPSILGRCALGDADTASELVFPGQDASSCDVTKLGCETFGGGVFTPSSVCETTEPPNPPLTSNAFMQPYLDCRPPLSGQAAGAGPDGDVCTWTAISGCTEPGRRFEDYASCDVVRTQRPYFGYDAPVPPSDDDPRLDDMEYLADVAWVRTQVEAAACVCCHSENAPKGAAGWTIDAGPLWLDTVADSGLAMMAGLVDSTVFGAYPADDNNGFSRDTTGLPTNDDDRMKAFLIAEYVRRGFSVDDAEDIPPFGGPLYAQLTYQPKACTGTQGVGADGMVRWTGTPARYVYILDAGASNPGVPPNLDVPEGTQWFIDVSHTQAAMTSPVTFGEIPANARQRVPMMGAPTLVSGETYYIVALFDVGVPTTRCLFTAP